MYQIFIATFIAMMGAASSATAAPCQAPDLESLPSTHVKCYYYTGTKHFRAKEYAAALEQWQAVVDQSDIPVEFEYLRANAQSNIGFLYYMGWGVEPNLDIAIERYWLPAEKAGHDEAAYHLCHAYADDGNQLALGYCREALRRYNTSTGTDHQESEIIAQLRKYIARLESR